MRAASVAETDMHQPHLNPHHYHYHSKLILVEENQVLLVAVVTMVVLLVMVVIVSWQRMYCTATLPIETDKR